jgi:hypothetical protein
VPALLMKMPVRGSHDHARHPLQALALLTGCPDRPQRRTGLEAEPGRWRVGLTKFAARWATVDPSSEVPTEGLSGVGDVIGSLEVKAHRAHHPAGPPA